MSAVRDLTGQKFGKLTVVSRAGSNKKGRATWNCVCDCGKKVVVLGEALTTGNTKSCGCLHSPDLTGKTFGILTVIGKDRNAVGKWVCKCGCGKEISVLTSNLKRGQKSCGCLPHESEAFHRSPRLYQVWRSMTARCEDQSSPSYPNYGGRGISVCNEWKDFRSFLKWAKSTGYDAAAPRGECTIDRIDPNGDYTPENCRWATLIQQCSNKRNTTKLTINGQEVPLATAAREHGIQIETLRRRINKGIPHNEAVETPVRKWERHHESN